MRTPEPVASQSLEVGDSKSSGPAPECDATRLPGSTIEQAFAQTQQVGAAMASRIRTLLLDNYDSYTYNLCQLLAEVNGGRRQA